MTGPEPALADGMRLPQLRAVWYSFFAAVAMMGITTWALGGDGDGADAVMLLVIGLVSVVDLGAMVWFRTMGDAALVTAESNEELRAVYTRRFVLGATMALSPGVIGFAVAVAAGDVVPYVIGTSVSIPALLYAGPTDTDIRARDQALIGAGRPMRLSAALGA
jgi:hypothetical protein